MVFTALSPTKLATVTDGKRVEARALMLEYTRSRAGMPRTTLRRFSRVSSSSAKLFCVSGNSLECRFSIENDTTCSAR